MRDSGRRPLPAADQVDIPGVEVRVWGDRAVSYDLQPSADGTGAVLRITNTGREAIPAVLSQVQPEPRDPEARASRSVVTVTASAGDRVDPDPVLLLAAPLVADLLPGDSVSFDVPAIEAATGRATNWLSVNLSVLGDASWLSAHAPVGAWFSDAGLSAPGSMGAVAQAGAGAPGSPTTVAPVATQTPTPTSRPSRRRRPSRRPTPCRRPPRRPAPRQRQRPRPAPTPTPTRNARPRASHTELLGAQRCDRLSRQLGQRGRQPLQGRQGRLVEDPRLDGDVHLHRLVGELDRSEGTDPGPRTRPSRRAGRRARRHVALNLRPARGALQALLRHLRSPHAHDQGALDAQASVRRHRRARRQVLTTGFTGPGRPRQAATSGRRGGSRTSAQRRSEPPTPAREGRREPALLRGVRRVPPARPPGTPSGTRPRRSKWDLVRLRHGSPWQDGSRSAAPCGSRTW